jgi:hypothetical protein
MKTVILVICVILLLINGIGALFGGFQLFTDPTGSKLQMPLSFLENSPFNDYLIPGIILFIVNGIFSFLALAMLILKKTRAHWFVLTQGVLLSGWILMQILMLRTFYAPLHVTFLAMGLGLVAGGLILKSGYSGK